MMAPAKRLLLVAAATTALRPTKLPPLQKHAKALAASLAAVGLALTPLAGIAEETSAGFEEFAAKGGTMEARPECFFDECGDQSKACFTNPSCLKGVTCLGNCRGEQECATRCFARFGSEKLNDWLSCTLEEKKCVVTGVKQDTSVLTQRLFLNVSELQVRVDGVCVTERRRNAADVAVRASTRLARETRSCRDGVVYSQATSQKRKRRYD